jgi:hypothetical protein
MLASGVSLRKKLISKKPYLWYAGRMIAIERSSARKRAGCKKRVTPKPADVGLNPLKDFDLTEGQTFGIPSARLGFPSARFGIPSAWLGFPSAQLGIPSVGLGTGGGRLGSGKNGSSHA